ncbi:MAG: LysM peptidoglycan-binding domain-containing protein [Minwuia sp.]|nr:LysM peptidoglycan-binding domain-containing protein [Minwuia sp.]
MNRILIVLIAVAAIIVAGLFMFSGDDAPEQTPQVAVTPPSEPAESTNAPQAIAPPAESSAAPVPNEAVANEPVTQNDAAAAAVVSGATDPAQSSTGTVAKPGGEVSADAAAQEMQTARNQPKSAATRAAEAQAKAEAKVRQATPQIADANPVASDGAQTRAIVEDKVEQKLDRIQDSAAAAADQVSEPRLQPVAPKRAPDSNQNNVAVIPKRAVLPPTFDVVRISDVDCTAVIAGTAPSRAIVRIAANGQIIATLRADGDGSWAHVTTEPFAPGGVELTLTAETTAGLAEAPESVVLVVPDCADLSSDGKAIALLTPKNRTGTRILQAPDSPDPIAMPKGLNLAKVDYDDNGNLEMSGSGVPDAELRAYVDGVFAGRTRSDAGGQWRIVPDVEVAPGVHVLRVDHVDGGGTVLARIELPFVRATPEAVRITIDQVVVQPGNSLWRIARRTYGRGISYTTIYEANQDRIRDPDLIYPGQVFNLPDLPTARN